MIRVKVQYLKNEFSSLNVRGHSMLAEHGQDIVCAGVSAVVIGGLNNLNEVEKFEIEIKDGYVDVLVKKGVTLTNHDLVTMETIITSLKTIAESYPDNVKVEEIL